MAAAVAGGLIVVPWSAGSSGPPPTTQPVVSLRALVVLANFQGETTPSLTRAGVSAVFDTDVNAFFLENSYGRVGVDATVTEWTALALNPTCDTAAVAYAAAAAVDPVVDFREFQHVLVVAAYAAGGPQPYCGWSGLASGTIALPTEDGLVSVTHAAVHSAAVNLAVIAHELGHNLGLGHASFLNCGARSWAVEGCSVLAYADYYSVMGRSTPARDLNAYQRDLLGWFDATRSLMEIRRSTLVTLTPLEDASPGVKAVKIPRPNGQSLYLEYRQPIGFDQGMDQGGFSDVFQGALLHVPRMRGHESLLIDPTPPGEPQRSVLPVGVTFVDPLSGIAVTVRQRTLTGLIVAIEYPPSAACRVSCEMSD